MRVALLGLSLCFLWVACGRVEGPRRASADAGSDDAGSAGAAPEGEAGDGGATGAATTELTLNVVHRDWVFGWVPAAGARVRVEGGDGFIDVSADASGHVVASVNRDAGPWDVTVALPQHNAVSVLGVTGPIAGAIHLSPLQRDDLDTQELRGAISGSVSCFLDGFRLEGWGLSYASSGTSRSYQATYVDAPGAPPLHLMASVTEPGSEALLNAVWLDVPRTGGALNADIVFPSPPRPKTRTAMRLRLPDSGVVVATGLEPNSRQAFRSEAGWAYSVGESNLEPSADGQPGHFDWSVDSFTGDMSPDYATADWADVTDRSIVIAHARVQPGAVVSVPPAEVLSAKGTSIATTSLEWSAKDYQRVGASIFASRSPGSWFVYSFGAAASRTHHWPHLPEGIALEDIGLGDPTELDLNVFALSEGDGVPPWNWTALEEQVAVVRRYHPFASEPEPPQPDPVEIVPTPLSCSMNGIYAVDDMTRNTESCETEGTSELEDWSPHFFVAQLTSGELSIASCESVSECRELGLAMQNLEQYAAAWIWHAIATGSHLDVQSATLTCNARDPDGISSCSSCTFSATAAMLASAGKLRLEHRMMLVPAFPAGAGNECSYPDAQAAAATSACSTLQVVTGHFLEAI